MESKNPILSFWQKSWWSKLVFVCIGFFIFSAIIGLFSPQGQKNSKEGQEAGEKVVKGVSESSSTPTSTPMATLTPTDMPLLTSPTPTSEPAPTETPTPIRKIVKGSTPKGIEFYEKVDSLHKQGKINGQLCTEFESDPIVDVNPDSQSVQLSLMYSSILGSVDNSDKALILNDFRVIKGLAEQDSSLILPEYGTLRLFVLTFHDSSCMGKGELQQLMIDPEPEWTDWK